jgi:hypothetical protein
MLSKLGLLLTCGPIFPSTHFIDPSHRPKIKWIPTLVPNWCTGVVYPSSNLIP